MPAGNTDQYQEKNIIVVVERIYSEGKTIKDILTELLKKTDYDSDT